MTGLNRRPAIDELRERIRRPQGAAARERPVLPFGIEAIDRYLPGGGLQLGALHEVAGGDDAATDRAAAALFVAAESRTGAMVGRFIAVARRRVGQTNQAMTSADIDELDCLRVYANRFHNDSNPVWQTAAINDRDLVGFAERSLRLTSRRRAPIREQFGTIALKR